MGNISTVIATAQGNLTEILADLANVDTTADLNTDSAALENVQEDVIQILNGTTSVNQAITLTNANGVAFANGLILA